MLDASRFTHYFFFNEPVRARGSDIIAAPVLEADEFALRIARTLTQLAIFCRWRVDVQKKKLYLWKTSQTNTMELGCTKLVLNSRARLVRTTVSHE